MANNDLQTANNQTTTTANNKQTNNLRQENITRDHGANAGMWGERYIGPFTIRRKLLRRRHAMKERRKQCNAKNNPQKSILQQALDQLSSGYENEFIRENNRRQMIRRPDNTIMMSKRKQESTTTSSFEMPHACGDRSFDIAGSSLSSSSHHAPRCYNIPTFISISPLKCRPRNRNR
mmetsp:Transcript_22526/g.33773  ORF Transcript_22526/g.33773 Transcript_22526/m.33773 type:complete len:177 (-) Transcript_22526:275-805(-)